MELPNLPPEPNFAAFVAIDWADRKHTFALQEAATGHREGGEIEHTPEAVGSPHRDGNLARQTVSRAMYTNCCREPWPSGFTPQPL